jgi:hypothetical protein
MVVSYSDVTIIGGGITVLLTPFLNSSSFNKFYVGPALAILQQVGVKSTIYEGQSSDHKIGGNMHSR